MVTSFTCVKYPLNKNYFPCFHSSAIHCQTPKEEKGPSKIWHWIFLLNTHIKKKIRMKFESELLLAKHSNKKRVKMKFRTRCKKKSYFNNFVQQVGTSYNLSFLFVHSMHLSLPCFSSHRNCENNVTIIPFAMGTH